MAGAYYNENDPYAAQWLRNLISAGHIAPGDVDERSIADVSPDDVRGYVQCHFFAGIAGWSRALRLAGWADDRPVWTASCPCQPFSNAGGQKGFSDERHLWPEVYRLLADLEPTTLIGEQVAGAADWLALVRRDLESLGYAVGAMPIEAASAGAEHFRDRYWFVADANCPRELQSQGPVSDQRGRPVNGGSNGIHRPMVNTASIGRGEGWTEYELRSRGFAAAVASIDGCQYVECPDGKWRRLPPPGVRWLGNGLPARMARLRAFGNAIDPRPAAQFIGAYLDCAG